jgi:hypothetical protein
MSRGLWRSKEKVKVFKILIVFVGVKCLCIVETKMLLLIGRSSSADEGKIIPEMHSL